MNFNNIGRYLYMTIVKDFLNFRKNEMNKLKLSIIILIPMLVFNTFVWTTIFKKYKENILVMTSELQRENERLNALVSEFKLEGMEVTVTMYHPVSRQTDSTPNILADGTRIRVHKASEYKFIAVSRNLLKRHGGFLDYGDFIILKGTDGKDGVYQVKDTMNKRFVNRIDILESPGTKPYKFDSAKIVKTNLVMNNN
jgi:archaellum component FlaF (FlaF/FlaG flagellin family)